MPKSHAAALVDAVLVLVCLGMLGVGVEKAQGHQSTTAAPSVYHKVLGDSPTGHNASIDISLRLVRDDYKFEFDKRVQRLDGVCGGNWSPTPGIYYQYDRRSMSSTGAPLTDWQNNMTSFGWDHSGTTCTGGLYESHMNASSANWQLYPSPHGAVRVRGMPSNVVIAEFASITPTWAGAETPVLNATPAGMDSIQLDWTSSTSPASFELERRASGDSTYSLISSPAGSVRTFRDSNLSTNASYDYRIRGKTTYGVHGDYSNTATATTWTLEKGLICAVTADCGGQTVTCGAGNTLKEPALNDGYHIGGPAPYVAPNPACIADAKYVALGDSYSSGEGVAEDAQGYWHNFPAPPSNERKPEEYYSDSTGRDNADCHRHPDAYGPRYAHYYNGSPYDFGDAANFAFYACSGAVMANISQDQRTISEPPQIDHADIGAGTKLVTLTIGGNDAGFADAIQACILNRLSGNTVDPGCPEDRKQNTTAYINSAPFSANLNSAPFSANLKEVYKDIKNAAPNARVVVEAYPRFFPEASEPSDFDSGQGCFKLASLFSSQDQTWINTTIDLVNTKINDATLAAVGDGAQYAGIQYNSIKATWDGHEICGTATEWINYATMKDLDYRSGDTTWSPKGKSSFHPNNPGHAGYANDLSALLQAWS